MSKFFFVIRLKTSLFPQNFPELKIRFYNKNFLSVHFSRSQFIGVLKVLLPSISQLQWALSWDSSAKYFFKNNKNNFIQNQAHGKSIDWRWKKGLNFSIIARY